MIQANLNPAQASKLRPASASLRTPRGRHGEDRSFDRLQREGAGPARATPALPPKPQEAPRNTADEEEEAWLFGFARNITTAEVWKMGFSRVIVFSTHFWVSEEQVCADISEAFRSKTPIRGLGAEHKETITTLIAPSFMQGDVLVTVQCAPLHAMPADDREAALRSLAKLVDCISETWNAYNDMEEPELGAVVIVLEGLQTDHLQCDWGAPGIEPVLYPITPLNESLAPHIACG